MEAIKFLHNHPSMEEALEIDDLHVIVDKKDWLEAIDIYEKSVKGDKPITNMEQKPMPKTHYSLAFLFPKDDGFNHVWLIRKTHPAWQDGSLNGLGGKVNRGEDPMSSAIREINEEGGILVKELHYVAKTEYSECDVHIYTGYAMQDLFPKTEEEVFLVPVKHLNYYDTISDVPYLVELCIAFLSRIGLNKLDIYPDNIRLHFNEDS